MLVLGRACWGQPICMRSQALPRYQHRALTRSCPSSSNCNSTGFVLLFLDSSPFLPLFSIAVCVCASHSSTFCDRGSSSLISLHVSSRSHSARAETERRTVVSPPQHSVPRNSDSCISSKHNTSTRSTPVPIPNSSFCTVVWNHVFARLHRLASKSLASVRKKRPLLILHPWPHPFARSNDSPPTLSSSSSSSPSSYGRRHVFAAAVGHGAQCLCDDLFAPPS